MGTSAEIIKISSVYHKLSANFPTQVISLDQQPNDIDNFSKEFQIQIHDRLSERKMLSLTSKKNLILWFCKLIPFLLKLILKFYKDPNKKIIIVQGDTLSAAIGSLVGFFSKSLVAHIEAGLRSKNIFHPFPEEINRRFISRISRINFSPSGDYIKNLPTDKVHNIDTNLNTGIDALYYWINKLEKKITCDHILVSLHRQELLNNRGVLIKTFEIIRKNSQEFKFVFLIDNLTKSFFKNTNINLTQSKNLVIVEKLKYQDFIKLIVSSTAIITDSGGLQEESAFLKINTLIHRKRTERFDGLGETSTISNWNLPLLESFIAQNKVVQTRNIASISHHKKNSPSQIIFDFFKKNQHIL